MTLELLSSEKMDAAATLWKREKRRVAARFTGVSMVPAIPSGSELTVACGEDGESGDVVVVLIGSQVRVHRLVAAERGGHWVLTRGDATAVPDLPAPASAILGRVVGLGRDGARPAPAAADSASQRAVLGVCRRVLRLSPAACGLLIRSLWLLRRWLVLYPAAAGRRLLRRGPSGRKEQDQPEPGQKARE